MLSRTYVARQLLRNSERTKHHFAECSSRRGCLIHIYCVLTQHQSIIVDRPPSLFVRSLKRFYLGPVRYLLLLAVQLSESLLLSVQLVLLCLLVLLKLKHPLREAQTHWLLQLRRRVVLLLLYFGS